MKKNHINKLESIARKGFLSKNNFTPIEKWQNEVIADIKRRGNSEKINKNIQSPYLFQPLLVWRLALASLAIAIVICFSLYLTLPESNSNEYQLTEVSFDNFDNYIEIIEQP